MSCWGPTSFTKDDIDGECTICGEPTVDGDAYEACEYSPVECETCGNAPCDESC